MRVDILDTDGVIQATCNIPDALWTSTAVQTAANAAAASHGMTLDVGSPDDTIDPHVQMVTTQADLVNWINGHAYTALGTGPAPPTTAASSGPTAGEIVVGVLALGAIATLIAWAFHR